MLLKTINTQIIFQILYKNIYKVNDDRRAEICDAMDASVLSGAAGLPDQ